jgi:protein-S-isoprenylcysteine O-methyltransferase Ste14
MSEAQLHRGVLLGMVAVGALVFVYLLYRPAPYGRHGEGRPFGPRVPPRLGWILMESPSVIAFAACYAMAPRPLDAATAVFFLMWQAHYGHRAFVFPFRLRKGAPMPLLVVASGRAFTGMNGWLNGRAVTALAPPYGAAWLADPRFVLGIILFVAGFTINFHADWILLHLRRPGETGYKIPRGGFYRWISCPNYFGEIIEWTGWALATWTPAGAVFAFWSVANLAPRAVAHHRWYRSRFPDYPPERRALVPFLV